VMLDDDDDHNVGAGGEFISEGGVGLPMGGDFTLC